MADEPSKGKDGTRGERAGRKKWNTSQLETESKNEWPPEPKAEEKGFVQISKLINEQAAKASRDREREVAAEMPVLLLLLLMLLPLLLESR